MDVNWSADRANRDAYEVPHRTGAEESLFESLLLGLVLLVLMLPWYSLRHPVITVLIGGSAWLYLEYGPIVMATTQVGLIASLVTWRLIHPSSFTRFVSRPTRSRWRGAWVYRRRWKTAMHMCGLSKAFGSTRYAPHVIKVRSNAFGDQVRVKLLMGQAPADFETKTDALASTFGAIACLVVGEKPGVVWLHFTHRDPLTTTVAAIEPAEHVNLAALPLGVCEDGTSWLLRLLGTQLLIVGATGAGKSSVVWSIIRALAAAIRDGLVQTWAIDPKGGIELAPGRRLFTRFTHEPEHMVSLVEDAAALVHQRAARMRGVSRLHTPTTTEPFIVLVIDELAFLTAYMPDRALTKRLHAALSVVLSQGRAVGVTVVAAVQDPRKEIINVRDLFPTRIALRLTEPAQVDMVLGAGARERGAHCHQIPESSPGVGYVLIEGHREPIRVRAAYVSDDDIADMNDTYPVSRNEVGRTPLHIVSGEVVA